MDSAPRGKHAVARDHPAARRIHDPRGCVVDLAPSPGVSGGARQPGGARAAAHELPVLRPAVLVAWTRHRAVSTPWRVITRPLGAFTIHAAALWIWHLPLVFQAALANQAEHALQHTSFLFSALLFWWHGLGTAR